LVVFYLSVLLLLPLSALGMKATALSWNDCIRTLSNPRVLSSLRLTFETAFLASTIATLFGFLVAWTLTRYRFIARDFLDAIVDLPFALPTAIAGIALATVFSERGWMGGLLSALGIRVAYTPAGIVLAMVFIGLPFVVRTVQPVISDLDPNAEEAARTLGASHAKVFWSITLPELLPALLTGFSLCFARALGEYGSVIFISGNLPMKTEVIPLVIVTKLEQYDFAGASVLAITMLLLSFLLIWGVQWIQRRTSPWLG
jgi:sulfate/thiosulfate transport system permease protein